MTENYIYKKVDAIIFGMLSPEIIKKQSCAKIVTPELYDREGYPVDGGVMDVRLGVIDPGLRCKTCGGKLKDCIGHFGHIELARPVIHYNYVDILLMFLRSTCRECSRILAIDTKIQQQITDLEEAEEESNEAVKKTVKSFRDSMKTIKKCPHCKAKQFTIKLEKPTNYLENDRRLSPTDIRLRLDKISDADVEMLGLNPKYARPEWMI